MSFTMLLFIVCATVGPLYYLVAIAVGAIFDGIDSPLTGGDNADFSGMDVDYESDISSLEIEMLDPEFEIDTDDLNLQGEEWETPQGEQESLEKDQNSWSEKHIKTSSYKFSYFSLRLITVTISGFGIGGLIGHLIGWGVPKVYIAAIVFAVGTFMILYVAINLLFTHSVYHNEFPQLIGRTGKVTLTIPAYGIGQVELVVNREMQTYRAQSKHRTKIPHGTIVHVLSINYDIMLLTVEAVV